MSGALRVLVLVLAAAAAAGAARAGDDEVEIHVCADDAGSVVYQTDPCPAPGTRRPRPRPAPAAPDAAQPAPPAGSARPAPPPGDPAPRTRTPRPTAPAVRPRVVPPAVYRPDPPSPADLAGPADPRLSTPERTFHTFVDAMRAGDRATARSCLISGALDRIGPLVASLPEESLRDMVAAFGRAGPAGEAGPFRSLRIELSGGRSKWIFLERTPRGEWKIFAI